MKKFVVATYMRCDMYSILQIDEKLDASVMPPLEALEVKYKHKHKHITVQPGLIN